MSDRERQLRDGWRARWVAKRMTERGDGYGAVLRRWAIEMRRSPSLHERALGHYFEALRRSAVSDRTPVYPEHHLPQAPALQRLGAIVDAGFPPDVADLYVKTPSWPRHPDIREVRAGLARQRAEKRTAR